MKICWVLRICKNYAFLDEFRSCKSANAGNEDKFSFNIWKSLSYSDVHITLLLASVFSDWKNSLIVPFDILRDEVARSINLAIQLRHFAIVLWGFVMRMASTFSNIKSQELLLSYVEVAYFVRLVSSRNFLQCLRSFSIHILYVIFHTCCFE